MIAGNVTAAFVDWARQHMRTAVVLFSIWALWLAAECWVFGPNSYVRIHDMADSRLPAFMSLVSNRSAGGVGWWAQQWAGGTDRLAQGWNNELGLLPFLILPAWLASALFLVTQRFIAGYFTYRLLRDDLELAALPAAYPALAYALYAQSSLNRSLTGFTIYDGLALPGIPLLLWMLGRIGRRGTPLLWTLAAAVVAAFGTILPFSMFIAPLVLFWFLFVAPRKEWQSWAWMMVFAAAWVALVVPTALPIALGAVASNRAHADYQAIWGGTLTKAVLAFRGVVTDNVLPIVLLYAGLAITRLRNRRLVAIAAAVAFCLLVGSCYYSLATLLHRVLGAFYGLNLERFTLLVPFLLACGAGLAIAEVGRGWEVLLRSEGRSLRYSAAAVLSVAAMATVGWTSITIKTHTVPDMIDGSNFRALYHDPMMQRLAERRFHEAPFRVATVAIGNINPHYVWSPGYAWAYGLETADGYLSFHGERYQQFWEAVLDPLLQRDHQRFVWVDSWGNQLYLFSPSDGFAPGTVRPRDYYNLDLLALDNVRYVISPVPLQDDSLVPLPNPDLQRQVAWKQQRRSRRLWDLLRGHYPGTPLYTYENTRVLPRAFVASRVSVAGDVPGLKQQLEHFSVEQLGDTAFVLAGDAVGIPVQQLGAASGRANLVRYASDQFEIETDAKAAGVLVVTNNYNRGWHAQVDGVATKIVPADLAFQGIFVPAGRHRVDLRYRPTYLP